MDFFEIFRYNLKVLRTSKELSAFELSNMLKLNSKRISNLEQKTHKPTSEELILISEFFKVTTENIIHNRCVVIFNQNN